MSRFFWFGMTFFIGGGLGASRNLISIESVYIVIFISLAAGYIGSKIEEGKDDEQTTD